MTKQHARRGRLIYALCLYLWGLLLLCAAIWSLSRVWAFAEAYESSRPTGAMERYVEQLNGELLDSDIAATIAAMPHEVQSDEEVTQRVREMLAGGIRYSRRGGGNGRAVYALLCGGNQIGTVTLLEDQQAEPAFDMSRFPWTLLPWSMRPWVVESTEFDFSGLYSSVEVVIPQGWSVWLNGLRLGAQYIVEEDIPYDVLAEYYPRCESLPTKVRYRFDHVIGRLAPEIRDQSGVRCSIDRGKDDSQFIKPCSEEELARMGQFTAGFIDNYLKYNSGVVDPAYGYQKLAPYLLAGGDLDQRMRDAMDGLSWAHTTSITVESSVLNSALNLGGGCYLLDITAQASTYAIGKGQQNSTVNMRVLVIKKNDDVRAVTLDLY